MASESQGRVGKILGVIPARGGSKGIPRKNLVPLAGKPLIQYTFEAALESEELEWVVLSTDDEEIADLGRKAGVDVPFVRPSHLATDEATTQAVIEHAVCWLERRREIRADGVMVLQPTSPLRRASHIDEAARLFRQAKADGVISVSPPREHPYDFVTFTPGEMRRAVERQVNSSRRQDWPELFFINGAIYLVRSSVVMSEHTILPGRSLPYLMDQRDSQDVDSTLDLEFVEHLLSQRSGRKAHRESS